MNKERKGCQDGELRSESERGRKEAGRISGTERGGQWANCIEDIHFHNAGHGVATSFFLSAMTSLG